ncbi:penicillin-insensitive murein endopeptidase [Zooshikella harenae]|uniref:Penicillin-insensitive murein endopeptidase n=1 Tax=Zooshikella harenae TaxID=2827238 RepID=A0ABS5ZB92_9GAMM|nr:penicillin-insensitive murein endopeptidase [Zooshikella harenae]MBU2711033.1 penicillin-insensitive murein endopeptidase [Zooshikella harenae]
MLVKTLFSFIIGGCCSVVLGSVQVDSTCYGTTAKGRLLKGVALPDEGKNYVAYSDTAIALGRTYVHSTVRDVILDAYKALSHTLPKTQFKYGEAGFKEGGRFRPHKTHQNGLSVDFMVPVKDKSGQPDILPTHIFNKFDNAGRTEDYYIDFPAVAAHLKALHQAAAQHGIKIWRVIFDPKLQPYLWQTADGAYLRRNLTFSKRRSWVRHDEHYHVDFIVPCKPLSSYADDSQ